MDRQSQRLHARAFGVVLLVLGACALLPVVSTAAGLLLAIPAFQMVRGHPAPVFSRRVAERPVATDKLTAVLARVIPALRFLELQRRAATQSAILASSLTW